MEKVVCAWSGGKDSAMALHEVVKSKRYDVLALLTTLTEGYDRISMHGVRRALLEEQAESLGFHLEKIYISKDSSNAEYESKMKAALEKYAAKGINQKMRCLWENGYLTFCEILPRLRVTGYSHQQNQAPAKNR